MHVVVYSRSRSDFEFNRHRYFIIMIIIIYYYEYVISMGNRISADDEMRSVVRSVVGGRPLGSYNIIISYYYYYKPIRERYPRTE